MSTAPLPVENIEKVLEEIVSNLGDDTNAALLTVSRLNKSWTFLSRPYIVKNLVLKDGEDFLKFLSLISHTLSTFPDPIPCETVILKSTNISEAGVAALRTITRSTMVPHSLTIHATNGGIPKAIVQALGCWTFVGKLTLGGQNHAPSNLFDHLISLPQLESLSLNDFSFDLADLDPQMRFAFPSGLSRLSLSQSATVWTLLRFHVIPGGGFDGIRSLRIRERFSFLNDGVWDMVACWGELRGVRTLELDAIHDGDSHDMMRSMANIFQGRGMPLARTRGLKQLRLNFSEIPAEFALNCIAWYTIYLPPIDAAVAVEIVVAQAPELWDNQDPSAQLRQLLVETCPRNDEEEVVGQSTLVVRGFPCSLPEDVQETGSALVCGYRVAFVASDDA